MGRHFGGYPAKKKKEEEEEELASIGAVPDDIPRPKGIENKLSPEFAVLARMFDRIEDATRSKTKRPGYKSDLLDAFFKEWRLKAGPDLFPALRLMLPDRDNRRRTYNLKENKLGKAYREALDLPPSSDAAIKLEKWKTPTQQDPGAGEFSMVAYEVIKSRSSCQKGSKTIDDVNRILDQLSVAGSNVGANGQKRSLGAEHARILKECVETMPAVEHKWLIRIILKDLKIGLGERGVFQALHPDAMELFNTCSDILRVCWKLHDPTYRLPSEENDVTPGATFRPMLCHRNQRDLFSIVKLMKQDRQPNEDPEAARAKSKANPDFYTADEFMIEEKLDGERMQLHKVGDRFSYYSRKGIDYTGMYGKDKYTGSLTPFIHDLFHKCIDEVILDGEMMVYDPAIEKYIPFGTLKTYASQTSFDAYDPRPCFIVFDIVYLKSNGLVQKLLTQPLSSRKKLLKDFCVTAKRGVIEVAAVEKCSTAQHISAYLKHILDTRGEGLCVKNPDSPYILGGRLTSWIKVCESARRLAICCSLASLVSSRRYMDELGETIDAVVIGGFWGQGKRAGRMSSFMVGLRQDDKPDIDGQPCCLSFAKVGSGFNMEAYERIHEKHGSKWITYDKKKVQQQHGWFTTVSEWPDVLIRPSDSFVVRIKAAEIVGGAEYGAGMTLRFPRAIKIRDPDEMNHTNCMTFKDVQKFQATGTKREFGDDLRGKKKTKFNQSKKARTITERLDGVEQVTAMFKGYTFYVHRGAHKSEIERVVVQHGGTIIQTIPEPSEFRVVIAEQFAGIKSKKGAMQADILLPTWVEDSVKARRLVPRVKRYYVHVLPATEESDEYNAMEEVYDEAKSEEEEDDFETVNVEEEDVKPMLPLSNFAYRDRDEDEEDEDAGSNQGFDDGPEPDTEESDSDEPMMQQQSSSAAPHDADAAAGPIPGFADVQIGTTTTDPVGLSGAPPGMGAGGSEQHFDDARLFDQMVAYFDSVENAALNALPSSENPVKTQERYSKYLREAQEAFVEHGGKVTTNLQDPTLIYIIVHRLDHARYSELIQRTSEPRHRRIVTHDWIKECIDEEGVLDPNDFAPP
ncbi:hypothetical protein RQP46_009177 [Phenoliferia psychrophenolica]